MAYSNPASLPAAVTLNTSTYTEVFRIDTSRMTGILGLGLLVAAQALTSLKLTGAIAKAGTEITLAVDADFDAEASSVIQAAAPLAAYTAAAGTLIFLGVRVDGLSEIVGYAKSNAGTLRLSQIRVPKGW